MSSKSFTSKTWSHMSTRVLFVLIAFLFYLNFLPLAIAKLNPDEFVSDGTVVIDADGETLQPRYEALAIAKQNAILQATCHFMSPKELADSYDVLRQTVLKNPQRYIRHFNILMEEERGGLLSVKIIARINLARLQQQLDLLDLNQKTVSRGKPITPKIAVIIPEVHIRRTVPDPAAETKIISELLRSGFRVVDQVQIAEIRYKDEVKQALRGDAKAAEAIGLEYGADIIIVGEAFSEFDQRLAAGLVSCSARVEARIVKTDTGEIIQAKGVHANGLDRTELLAGKKALTNAGSEMAQYLIKQLRNIRSDFTLTQIVVSNISFSVLNQLISRLESIPTVNSVRRENFTQGVAKLEVRFRGTTNDLSHLLSQLKFEDFTLDITGFSGSRIDVEVQK